MATKFADRVLETTTTAGTGSLALGGTLSGYQRFSAVCSVGDRTYYSVWEVDAAGKPSGQWETGFGTYSGPNTLARTTISASSNGGSAVDFSGSMKYVTIAVTEAQIASLAAPTAVDVSVTPAGTISSTDVQSALEELDTDIGEARINVKRFGAKGDSTINNDGSGWVAGTDDTSAMQAAINYASGLGGGTVYFPEGNYWQSAYLTLPANVILEGAGRRASRLVGTHAGGGGANAAEDVRNGSNIYNAFTINATTNAHNSISDLGLLNVNDANVGAGFYQQSGAVVRLKSLEVVGQKYPLIFDQTEDLVVDQVEPSTTTTGGIACWIVNGADLNPSASAGFTNAISFLDLHPNCSSDAYAVVDDGGTAHNFIGGDYNCGINAIRAAGVQGLLIEGIYAESQTGEIISLNSTTLSGAAAGGSNATIIGGQFNPTAGNAAIKGHGVPGELTVIGGNYSASAAQIVNAALFYGLSIISPGLPGYPDTVQFCDGVADGHHFESMRVRSSADGRVGVPNYSGVTGGITFTPGAGAGFIETFNSGGARQGYGFFLNGTKLQFAAEGTADGFEFLSNITAPNLGTASAAALDVDGTLAANSDSNVASQKAVKTYVDGLITGTLKFKGSTDCSANPNYPAALKGDVYVVSVAGKIGGASGMVVDVGDEYFATANNAGGTQAAVGASWDVLERNDVLAAVALSGAYSDLTGKPTLGTSAAMDAATAAQVRAGTASKVVTADALVAAVAPQTLTDASTVNWDMSTAPMAKVTLGASRTLAVSNPVAGQTYSLNVTQGGAGSWLVTWPGSFDWGTTGVPVLTTTAGKHDRITLVCTDAVTPKFDAFLSGKGFS